jgi:cell division protein FtsL
MIKKQRKFKILRIEKLIYGLIVFVAILIPVANVFSKALLSESNIQVEKLETKINKQVGINDSLNMQINELASLDKIQAVANELGLSYNNDNIKLITSE